MIQTPVGLLTICADGKAVCSITVDAPVTETHPNDITELAKKELLLYFAGKLREFTVPVQPDGTDFQLRVWRALCDIPYGQTVSYGDISEAVTGSRRASRAVGGANHANPIPFIIPCHRVVASGGIGGYGLGIDKKQFLLALESEK